MKRIRLFVPALALSMFSLLIFATPRALAANFTWDGGGSDDKMTTAANWVGDVAPSAGSDLLFLTGVAEADRTVDNDFSADTSFNSITLSGAATSNSDYDFSGNAITLVAGISNNMTGSGVDIGHTFDLPITLNGNQTFDAGVGGLDFPDTLSLASFTLTFDTGSSTSSINGVISGTGGITKTDTGTLILRGNNTFSGAMTVSAGELVVGHQNGLGTSAGGTVVSNGAALYIYQSTGDVTYAEPLTLAGTGISAFSPTLSVGNSFGSGGGGSTTPYPTSTFSGPVTLQSAIKVGAGGRNGKITGALTGNFAISVTDNSVGTFEIAASSNGSATANSVLAPPTKETTYSDDQANTGISVYTNETAIVTGKRGSVSVNAGGILKGTGTVGSATISGKIAPGLSPGCLTTGDLTLFTGSTYDFEVGGKTACSQYDQIVVNGAVQLAGTLNLTLWNGFKPVAGQKYTIISNDGSDAVSGTFDSLDQGATLTVGSYKFSVSYNGGDGNDVVLTVTAGAASTGFSLMKSNPLVSMIAIFGAAGMLALLARRNFKPATARSKR